MRNFIRLLALYVGLTASAAQAMPACTGRDMLAEFAKSEPAVHREIMAKAAETENANALLWKIEKPGTRPSWLFGTVHLTDERVTNLSPATAAALTGARVVALEVADLSTEGLAKAMAEAMPLLLNTSGSGLDRVLPAEDYAKVRAVVEEAGIPLQVVGMVRPWFVYSLMAVPACERARTIAGRLTLDRRLAATAQERKIPIVGLETTEEQLAALAGIPEPQQLELLRMALKLSSRIEDLTETLVLLYLRRQVGAVWPLNIALARKAEVSDIAFQGFETDILVKRNYRMRDGLLPLLADGGVFSGVGALHLVGKEGLVTLLRDAGYTVTAIE